MNDTPSGSYIALTADIVSAYVSNNTVSASDIPSLISQVHSALMRVSAGQSDTVTWLRVAANYVVPFIVSNAGALSATRAETDFSDKETTDDH